MQLKFFIFTAFVLFTLSLLSDDAPSEDVEIEVVEIIGSQEEALKIAGAATVINSYDL